ncbi:LysM peptidoglycan-binding domain-containing protein [Paenibacillus sp. ACRRX]|uniref:LysM peptidoglycan-binding domain-containing protein n=1 Tax=Paenibacillus sp. ACRRX TaxID=2918206 RepID=UPI001EF6D94A|nr:LysM peptidoglycan-binding domain-containing protein [Paenibacillus sp. ACRRX]
MKIHIVKKGESLYSLSQKYGVSLDTLISMNPQLSDPNKLDVGMKVKVPSTVHSTGGYEIVHKHVVKEGDTMWKLAKAWGIPLQAMIAANPQLKNPNVFLIGQVVNIPKVTMEHSHAHGQSEDHSNEQGSAGLQSGKGGILPSKKAAATSPKPKHELLKPKAEVTQPQAPSVVPPTPVAPAKPNVPAPTPISPSSKGSNLAPTPISPNSKGSNLAPTPISPSSKGSNLAPTPISPSSKGSNLAPTPISPSSKGSNLAPTPISPSSKGSNLAPTPISPSSKGSNLAPTPISPSSKGPNLAPTPISPSSKGSSSSPVPFAANANVPNPSYFPTSAATPPLVENGVMGLTYEQFMVQYPMTPVPCNPYDVYPTGVHPSMTCGHSSMHGYPGSVGGIGNAVPGYMPTGLPAGGPPGVCEPNYQPYDCYNPYAAPVLPAHAVIEPANPFMTAHIQSVQSAPHPYQPMYSVPDAGQWYGHGVNPEQAYMPYGHAPADGSYPELGQYSQYSNQAQQVTAGGVPRQEDNGAWMADNHSTAAESGTTTSTKKKAAKKEYKTTKKKAKVSSVEARGGGRARKQSAPWING